MKTITVQIGNSDNKLTQSEWSDFISKMESIILCYAQPMHFSGGSSVRAAWQNYCFVFDAEDLNIKGLKNLLAKRRAEYKQDSVAWTEGETQFI